MAPLSPSLKRGGAMELRSVDLRTQGCAESKRGYTGLVAGLQVGQHL
jgi:hypothetical protein